MQWLKNRQKTSFGWKRFQYVATKGCHVSISFVYASIVWSASSKGLPCSSNPDFYGRQKSTPLWLEDGHVISVEQRKHVILKLNTSGKWLKLCSLEEINVEQVQQSLSYRIRNKIWKISFRRRSLVSPVRENSDVSKATCILIGWEEFSGEAKRNRKYRLTRRYGTLQRKRKSNSAVDEARKE